MAFPTTITGITLATGGIVPYISSGGNVYLIGKSTANANKIRAFKATDPTSSFSNVGTDPTVTALSTLISVATFQVGDVIHVATIDDTAITSINIQYHKFDMSTDTWTLVNEAVVTAYAEAATGDVDNSAAITVRSNGDVILLYNGAKAAVMGVDRERVYYARRVSGSWTVDVAVDNAGATSWFTGSTVVGSSDRMHFFFQDGDADDAYERALTSANVLETFPASFDATIDATQSHFKTQGVSYVSGANTKVRYPLFDATATTLNSAKCDSADAPTMSEDSDITGATNPGAALYNSSFAANGTTLWHTFVESVTFDILTQSNADDAGWSATSSFYAGTVVKLLTNVFTRNGDIVLAIVFGETDTKYTEKVLVVGGNIFSIISAATLTGSGKSTASANFTETAIATLTGTGAATAKADWTETAVATLTGTGAATAKADLSITAIALLADMGASIAAGAFSDTAIALLTGSGKSTAAGALNAAAVATVTMAGAATDKADWNAVAAAVLADTGAAVASADWSSSALAALTFGGTTVSVSNTLSAAAIAVLSAYGASTAAADWSAAAVAVLTAGGVSLYPAALSETAIASLVASGAAVAAGDFSQAALAVLTGAGAASAAGSFNQVAAATLSGASQSTVSAAANLTAAASLTVTSAAIAAGDAVIAVTANLTAEGTQVASGSDFISIATSVFAFVSAPTAATKPRQEGKRPIGRRQLELDDEEDMLILSAAALACMEQCHGYH